MIVSAILMVNVLVIVNVAVKARYGLSVIEGKKDLSNLFRLCHDGGLSKTIEHFPTPVKMESFPDIFNICPKNAPYCKIDDSKGFNQKKIIVFLLIAS